MEKGFQAGSGLPADLHEKDCRKSAVLREARQHGCLLHASYADRGNAG
jgi:hypothetical protein